MVGGMCGGSHAWQGGTQDGGGACMVGGMCGRGMHA